MMSLTFTRKDSTNLPAAFYHRNMRLLWFGRDAGLLRGGQRPELGRALSG